MWGKTLPEIEIPVSLSGSSTGSGNCTWSASTAASRAGAEKGWRWWGTRPILTPSTARDRWRRNESTSAGEKNSVFLWGSAMKASVCVSFGWLNGTSCDPSMTSARAVKAFSTQHLSRSDVWTVCMQSPSASDMLRPIPHDSAKMAEEFSSASTCCVMRGAIFFFFLAFSNYTSAMIIFVPVSG